MADERLARAQELLSLNVDFMQSAIRRAYRVNGAGDVPGAIRGVELPLHSLVEKARLARKIGQYQLELITGHAPIPTVSFVGSERRLIPRPHEPLAPRAKLVLATAWDVLLAGQRRAVFLGDRATMTMVEKDNLAEAIGIGGARISVNFGGAEDRLVNWAIAAIDSVPGREVDFIES